MVESVPDAGKGRWSIHVPKRDTRFVGTELQDFFFQKLVKHAYPTVLDHQIAIARHGQQSRNVTGVLVHDGIHIREIAAIAILLTSVGIGLGKSDRMTQRVKLFVESAIVRARAGPS